MKKIAAILLVFATFILIACSKEISQNEAQEKALQFVKAKIKFYTKNDNQTNIVQEPKTSSVDSYKDSDFWIVTMHIVGESANGTKNNDLMVKVDQKGNVIDVKAMGQKPGP